MNRRSMLIATSGITATLAGCGSSVTPETSKSDRAQATPSQTTADEPDFKARFNRRPSVKRALTDQEAATEGQVLAILLIAMHQDEFTSLDASATPTGALAGVNSDVYTKLHNYISADAARKARVKYFVNGFKEVVQDATMTVLGSADNTYDDDPNACLSASTLAKVKVALQKV